MRVSSDSGVPRVASEDSRVLLAQFVDALPDRVLEVDVRVRARARRSKVWRGLTWAMYAKVWMNERTKATAPRSMW